MTKLDTTKPMMRRDGVKVTEFHVWKDGTITARLANGLTIVRNAAGRVGRDGAESAFDLINAPEPLFVWVAVKDGERHKPTWSEPPLAADAAYFVSRGYTIKKVDVAKGEVTE